MDVPDMDYSKVTPFCLMRDYGMSHIQIFSIQQRLKREGKSLWDWVSYEYLYSEDIKRERFSQRKGTPSASAVQEASSGWENLSVDVCGSSEDAGTVAEFVEQLSEKQQEALRLLYIERRGIKEVSALLGISVGAVSQRKRVAVDRLKYKWEHRNVS